MNKKIQIATLALLVNINFASAQNLLNQDKLLINKINFKNSTADWAEIVYLSSNNLPINLKGYSFADDKVFKKIDSELIINPSQIVTLRFKNTDGDTNSQINTDHKGLTATTEQLIIYDPAGQVADAVCWSNSTPAKTELTDLKDLFKLKGWNSDQPESCINSEKIDNNESIVRKNYQDTGTKEDWIIELDRKNPDTTSQPTKKTASSSKSTSKNPSKSKKSSTRKYLNGNLSSQLLINEIMPNPAEDDSKNEWIEIYNPSSQDINLGNWELDDQEGASKPFVFSDQTIIKANNVVTVYSKDSKIGLGNTLDQIRLIDYQGKLINEIEYQDAPSGQSYALIKIAKIDGTTENQWNWTKQPTPNTINPIYYQLAGKIFKEPEFSTQYNFKLETDPNKVITINFDEENIAGPLAKISFQKGNTVELLATKTNDTTYNLQSYKVLETATNRANEANNFWGIAITSLAAIAVGLYLAKKKFKR